MKIEKIEARIQELQTMAKQHELAMIQISGAIQELTALLSQLKGESDATDQVNDPQGAES